MTDRRRACVVASGMLTPYGTGTDACWNGLMSGRTALAETGRFPTGAFQSAVAGIVPGLAYQSGESLAAAPSKVWRPPASLAAQMVKRLLAGAAVPPDAALILATIKGEVDLLERDLLAGSGDGSGSDPVRLLGTIRALAGVTDRGAVVSAACASSTVALARAAALVASGQRECVLVVACDAVTEFIYSGFSSLMALDRVPARPFDKNRTGLSVGEAAAYALVMSGSRAGRERRGIEGEIAGWGVSCDANHMTGPSRDGVGQAAAIRRALGRAFVSPAEIGAMSAHGTGTVYNDSMEMKGFRSVFGDGPRPVYSVKGGIGHTMGAAGLVEALIAIKAMREGVVPPTVGMELVDPEAAGWVQREARTIGKGKIVLSTNSGFGGVNAALVMRPTRSAA